MNKSIPMRDNKTALGSEITSWLYKPPKSNRFLYATLGVLASLVLFMIYYGQQVLPWIKRIPAVVLYLLIFLISPVLKYLSGLGREEEWVLYGEGYLVRIRGKNNQREERYGWWRDYSSCSYDARGVILVPRNALRRNVRVFANRNTMEIYSICRERISVIHAQEIEASAKASKVIARGFQKNSSGKPASGR